MFERAQPKDLPFIQECIERFRLDDENLKAEQFILIREGGRIVAFGRIKPYRMVYELGCVGVVEEKRRQGLGRKVVEELIRRFPTPDVYLTTDLPEYFERLGFRRIESGPEELFAKIRRVCHIRTGVVAMVFRKEVQN